MTHQVFHYSHRVTYGDCTVGNHVYYSRYLEFFEAARGEFFRAAGVPFATLQAEGAILPVVECHLRYAAPARYDDTLTIEVWLGLIERVKMQFEYRVLREQTELVRAATLHVCTTLEEKPRRIPEHLRRALGPYLAST